MSKLRAKLCLAALLQPTLVASAASDNSTCERQLQAVCNKCKGAEDLQGCADKCLQCFMRHQQELVRGAGCHAQAVVELCRGLALALQFSAAQPKPPSSRLSPHMRLFGRNPRAIGMVTEPWIEPGYFCRMGSRNFAGTGMKEGYACHAGQ